MKQEKFLVQWRGFAAALVLLMSVQAPVAYAADAKKMQIDNSSFRCLTEMTPVRHFYVDNLLGNLKETVAVAKSEKGGIYPPGSVVQLVPGEVMVKHAPGYNVATHDWEYFELDVSKQGSSIRKRGFADVVNRFGGNCFTCHVKAKPEFDSICEMGHGCDAIPLSRQMIHAIQNSDLRCKSSKLTDEDKLALKQLEAFQKANAPK
jgi:ferredoxin